MDELKFVIVAGYGWSGSSAVVDLLKEFSCCKESDVEFRLIKDPYGLLDLRYNLVEHWDLLNSDNAIKDFIWHTEKLNNKPKKFRLDAGLSYEENIGPLFMEATRNFISKIVNFEYESDWWMTRFKQSKYERLITKIENKISETHPKMYFTDISEKEFDNYVKEYLEELYAPYKTKGIEYVILDQGIPPQNTKGLKEFFNNAKMIIVDRDPRDIYADLKQGGNLIGKELSRTNDCIKYISYHKKLRENIEEIKNRRDVLYIQFEDLVLHYDEEVKKIIEFLGINAGIQDVKSLFDPVVSAKNVNLWKNVLEDEEASKIYESLKEYAYKNKKNY